MNTMNDIEHFVNRVQSCLEYVKAVLNDEQEHAIKDVVCVYSNLFGDLVSAREMLRYAEKMIVNTLSWDEKDLLPARRGCDIANKKLRDVQRKIDAQRKIDDKTRGRAETYQDYGAVLDCVIEHLNDALDELSKIPENKEPIAILLILENVSKEVGYIIEECPDKHPNLKDRSRFSRILLTRVRDLVLEIRLWNKPGFYE